MTTENLFTNINDLENKLDAERTLNNKSSWSKLDKSTKLQKIKIFCNSYDVSSNSEKELLYTVLKTALEQNKLQKIKNVVYDIDKQEIKDIPVLIKNSDKFYIKNEKRISTSKSLPVKNKTHNTKKKKHKIDNKD
tara:strand:- start:79 stop:483 length:405 start_codon:yes stop_codon:yes gene_type:complete